MSAQWTKAETRVGRGLNFAARLIAFGSGHGSRGNWVAILMQL